MVRAADRPADLTAVGRAEHGAPVPADVEEGAELLVTAPDNDHVLVADGHPDETARRRHVLRPARVHPLPGEDVAHLPFKDRGIGVVAAGQGR